MLFHDTNLMRVVDVSMIVRGVNNIITDQSALLRQVIDERSRLSDGELLLALSARLRADAEITP